MKNLFVVQSPFQLLSAIEAANYFSQDQNILVVSYSPEEINNRQMDLVMSSFCQWENVFVTPPVRYIFEIGLKQLWVLKQMCRAKYQPDRVFIGEYRSWQMFQYFYTLSPHEWFLLDDGNATLHVQKEFISKMCQYPVTNLKERFKRAVLMTVLGLNTTKINVVNLFTCFKLEPFSSEQKVLMHAFEYTKAKVRDRRVDLSKIFFFGSNLSGIGMLSERREIVLLKEIADYYEHRGLTMVYVPHRRESAGKIDKIRKALNVEILLFNVPAEIQFANMEILPKGIAAFFSTVLFTLPKIVTLDSVDAFRLSSAELAEHYRLGTNQVYADYLQSGDINVIDIK